MEYTNEASIEGSEGTGRQTSNKLSIQVGPESVVAAPPAATITTPASGPTYKVALPTLTSVSLTNKYFRVAKNATAVSAKKTSLGTSFHFTLSAAAKLQITITSTAPGLRLGRSCLAPSANLKRAHAKPCTRTLTAGTLTHANEPQGADSIAFTGRIGARALTPRSYTALLSVSNTAGNSKPVTLSFTVVR